MGRIELHDHGWRNPLYSASVIPAGGAKMDLNKLTLKSQEAISEAQNLAVRHGHVEVDGEHLLAALLEQPDGLLSRLLLRMSVPLETFVSDLETELARRPKVAGPGSEAGKVYITQRLNQILVKAEDEAKRLKDEYVSVEHIALAFIDEGKSTFSGKLFTQNGVSRDRFLQALTEDRGNQRVTTSDPDHTYEPLSRYGRELVDEAHQGKLDPVIGRDCQYH